MSTKKNIPRKLLPLIISDDVEEPHVKKVVKKLYSPTGIIQHNTNNKNDIHVIKEGKREFSPKFFQKKKFTFERVFSRLNKYEFFIKQFTDYSKKQTEKTLSLWKLNFKKTLWKDLETEQKSVLFRQMIQDIFSTFQRDFDIIEKIKHEFSERDIQLAEIFLKKLAKKKSKKYGKYQIGHFYKCCGDVPLTRTEMIQCFNSLDEKERDLVITEITEMRKKKNIDEDKEKINTYCYNTMLSKLNRLENISHKNYLKKHQKKLGTLYSDIGHGNRSLAIPKSIDSILKDVMTNKIQKSYLPKFNEEEKWQFELMNKYMEITNDFDEFKERKERVKKAYSENYDVLSKHIKRDYIARIHDDIFIRNSTNLCFPHGLKIEVATKTIPIIKDILDKDVLYTAIEDGNNMKDIKNIFIYPPEKYIKEKYILDFPEIITPKKKNIITNEDMYLHVYTFIDFIMHNDYKVYFNIWSHLEMYKEKKFETQHIFRTWQRRIKETKAYKWDISILTFLEKQIRKNEIQKRLKTLKVEVKLKLKKLKGKKDEIIPTAIVSEDDFAKALAEVKEEKKLYTRNILSKLMGGKELHDGLIKGSKTINELIEIVKKALYETLFNDKVFTNMYKKNFTTYINKTLFPNGILSSSLLNYKKNNASRIINHIFEICKQKPIFSNMAMREADPISSRWEFYKDTFLLFRNDYRNKWLFKPKWITHKYSRWGFMTEVFNGNYEDIHSIEKPYALEESDGFIDITKKTKAIITYNERDDLLLSPQSIIYYMLKQCFEKKKDKKSYENGIIVRLGVKTNLVDSNLHYSASTLSDTERPPRGERHPDYDLTNHRNSLIFDTKNRKNIKVYIFDMNYTQNDYIRDFINRALIKCEKHYNNNHENKIKFMRHPDNDRKEYLVKVITGKSLGFPPGINFHGHSFDYVDGGICASIAYYVLILWSRYHSIFGDFPELIRYIYHIIETAKLTRVVNIEETIKKRKSHAIPYDMFEKAAEKRKKRKQSIDLWKEFESGVLTFMIFCYDIFQDPMIKNYIEKQKTMFMKKWEIDFNKKISAGGSIKRKKKLPRTVGSSIKRKKKLPRTVGGNKKKLPKSVGDNKKKLPRTVGSSIKRKKKLPRTVGGDKKIVRKHRGIIQTGGNKGKLRKGYKYTGKRLKNGSAEIKKVKKN